MALAATQRPRTSTPTRSNRTPPSSTKASGMVLRASYAVSGTHIAYGLCPVLMVHATILRKRIRQWCVRCCEYGPSLWC
eukprot:3940901-Rhodomonas_salina.2